jgi:predicted RNase H-like nuclease (RuvC/YqgF family)
MRLWAMAFVCGVSVLLTMNLVQFFTNRALTRELELCRQRAQESSAQLRVLAAAAAASAATPSAADNSALEQRAVAMVRRERELERGKCADVGRQFASLRTESDALSRHNMKLEREVADLKQKFDTVQPRGDDDFELQTYVAALANENRALRDSIIDLIIDEDERH